MDLVLFQVCWFATVLGVTAGVWWLGPLFVAGSLVLHHAGFSNWTRELTFILVGGSLGYLLDSLLVNLGLLSFPGFENRLSGAPAWMFTQWLVFCSLFHTTLDWMRGRYFLGALLGAVGGPLSYGAADRLGALSFGPSPGPALVALALVWAAVLPGLLALAVRIHPAD